LYAVEHGLSAPRFSVVAFHEGIQAAERAIQACGRSVGRAPIGVTELLAFFLTVLGNVVVVVMMMGAMYMEVIIVVLGSVCSERAVGMCEAVMPGVSEG
jgi:hypothetical protein